MKKKILLLTFTMGLVASTGNSDMNLKGSDAEEGAGAPKKEETTADKVARLAKSSSFRRMRSIAKAKKAEGEDAGDVVDSGKLSKEELAIKLAKRTDQGGSASPTAKAVQKDQGAEQQGRGTAQTNSEPIVDAGVGSAPILKYSPVPPSEQEDTGGKDDDTTAVAEEVLAVVGGGESAFKSVSGDLEGQRPSASGGEEGAADNDGGKSNGSSPLGFYEGDKGVSGSQNEESGVVTQVAETVSRMADELQKMIADSREKGAAAKGGDDGSCIIDVPGESGLEEGGAGETMSGLMQQDAQCAGGNGSARKDVRIDIPGGKPEGEVVSPSGWKKIKYKGKTHWVHKDVDESKIRWIATGTDGFTPDCNISTHNGKPLDDNSWLC
jgi:hypothetical protein